MLDRLRLPPLPTLRGERVILRGFRESDIDDRLRHPIDPEEEDGYGSSWRREWDGHRYHSREHLTARREQLSYDPKSLTRIFHVLNHMVENDRVEAKGTLFQVFQASASRGSRNRASPGAISPSPSR